MRSLLFAVQSTRIHLLAARQSMAASPSQSVDANLPSQAVGRYGIDSLARDAGSPPSQQSVDAKRPSPSSRCGGRLSSQRRQVDAKRPRSSQSVDAKHPSQSDGAGSLIAVTVSRCEASLRSQSMRGRLPSQSVGAKRPSQQVDAEPPSLSDNAESTPSQSDGADSTPFAVRRYGVAFAGRCELASLRFVVSRCEVDSFASQSVDAESLSAGDAKPPFAGR
ncbi:uncharacterized protein SCHCODRAFT_01158670 [Schizophyllum commune H4-8]|nr:uncharacterized protein SCHCODRAFT_01158670 [Schizophyllum commune H4-8]KAI5888120.1 hypothetical protein SCHCODRAFT_01158670 [Schizophyllum commune H4-8]